MSSLDCPKLPLIDIQNATNNFADENIVGRDGFGNDYKGKLVLRSGELIDIVARRLDRKLGHGTKQFQTQIVMLSSLKHHNLISIVGFCDESGENVIINKFEAKGSLDRYLSDPVTLTWAHRLYICLGIARALSYIHYDERRSFSVIHRDVKSSKIFLSDIWEAKLSGFELSMMQPATRRHDLVPDIICGTLGYVDPAYRASYRVGHKSDVYSLGVVLFEVLTGRKAFIKDEEGVYLAELAKSSYKDGKLSEIIHPDLHKQMHQGSLQVFSKEAYSCLNEQPTQRPNIDEVIVALKRSLELQLAHENSVKYLQHLEIRLDAIKVATENFAEEYCIGKGGFGKVYKAELEYFDSSAVEGDKQSGLPKKRSTTAIKTISKREDKEGEKGFYAEISTLSSCKHANIVSLLGFCHEPSNMILVYEHVSNGSLDDCLRSEEKMTNLTWVRRINICIDIARGLDYLHATTYCKRKIIHTDIKSANILLGENWQAKIADFGLSRFHPLKDMKSSIITKVDGTPVYLDPEYERTRKLKKESDVYSFGVVLFEILTGKLAYHPDYTKENVKGLAPIVRKHYAEKTLSELVDPKLKEQRDEKTFTLSKGPDQRSLRTFFDIGCQGLAEKQAHRPTMKVIMNKLEEALYFQETHEDSLRISFEDIRRATQDFNHKNLIAKGVFGKLYKGEITHADEPTPIVANRSDLRPQGEKEFLTKLAILLDHKHENIIGLVGYCNENNERISVFEYASNGSLDMHLKDGSLTWTKRLKIAIDIATGLDFLHGGSSARASVIHRDIKSANILLNSDWKAKITDLGFSMITVIDNQTEFVEDDAYGTLGYVDPQYVKPGSRESDIYSLGVVLFEMMCGRTTCLHGQEDLVLLVKRYYEEEKPEELVFKDISDIIVPKSLTTFHNIAYQCLSYDRGERPTASEVALQLKKALGFQETYNETDKDDLQISFEEIGLATQNFSKKIGRGGFGGVFKGEISSANGATAIAVKRHDAKYGQGEKEFLTEIKILSEYKHRNIVGLLGYCEENNEKILVYEYASNGSLDKHLNDPNLTWTKRLKICIDIATGLQFLHGDGSTQDAVIHRDIKSHNILLNDKWTPKITDFGLSMIAPINKEIDFVYDNACGTPGYIDPLYSKRGFLTKESDIYSFGVVLVEILRGIFVYSHDEKGGRYTSRSPHECPSQGWKVLSVEQPFHPDSPPTSAPLTRPDSSRNRKVEHPFHRDSPSTSKPHTRPAYSNPSGYSHSLPQYASFAPHSSECCVVAGMSATRLASSNDSGNSHPPQPFPVSKGGNYEVPSIGAYYAERESFSCVSRTYSNAGYSGMHKTPPISSNIRPQNASDRKVLSTGSFVPVFRRAFEEGKVDELVFEGIKDKMAPKSLIAFLKIAYACLLDEREKRPTTTMVVSQLKEALEFQVDYEIWGAKLPKDYKEIIQMSKFPKLYANVSNEVLYNMFSKGILLKEGKVCLSINTDGERNEMVSATMFSYQKNRLHNHKRISILNSRFQRVVKVTGISNLNIQIKIKTQLLTPNVIYGAHLIFKFCNPRQVSSKLMYVNLKYKMQSITLHAYFATCGNDEWMRIELCRFIPHKKDVDFEVSLECLSRYYCGSGAIYVEGIHFQAINDSTSRGVQVQGVLKSNSGSVQQASADYDEITELEDGEKLSSSSKVVGKRCHMLPAKMVLHDTSDVNCFIWKSLAEPESRFQEAVEILAQVFRIKCKIEAQKLSADTSYACYLVFKLSQQCHGLHCPVRVRDLLLWKNEEFKFVYLRSPTLVNIHGNYKRVPKLREDGLMEVIVWEFNSSNKFSDDHLHMILKLRCYEGTMSGLTVYGIEFRPL